MPSCGRSAMSSSAAAAPAAGVNTARLWRAAIYGALLLFALIYLLPLFVMLVTSSKTLEKVGAGTSLRSPRRPPLGRGSTAWARAGTGLTGEGFKGFFGNPTPLGVPAVGTSPILALSTAMC